MSTNLKATTNNLIFGYSNIFLLIIKNIVIIPFYLKFFSLSTIGLWMAASNVLTILSSIDLGLNIVLTQKLATINLKLKENSFMRIFSSGALIFCIIALIFFFISFIYVSQISKIFVIPIVFKSDLTVSLLFTAIALSFNILLQAFTSMFQALKYTFGTGLGNFLSNLLEVILLFILLFNSKSLISIGLSILIASTFNLVFHFFLFRRLCSVFKLQVTRFDVITVKLLFNSSVPLFFSRVTRALMNNSQATILSIFVNNQSAAIFEITVKLYKTAIMFLAPIGSSVFSSIASSFSNAQNSLIEMGNFRFKIKRLILFFLLLSIVIFSYVVFINFNFIAVWSGRDSYGGVLLTLVCFFSFFFQTFTRFLTFILNSLGVISIISRYEILEMIIRLVLLLALVKLYGIYGIPISEIISTGLILIPKIVFELNKKIAFTLSFQDYLRDEFSLLLLPTLAIIFTVLYSFKIDTFNSLVFFSFIYIIFSSIILILFSKTFRDIGSNLIQSKSISKAIIGK
jgi:O-antigen/teichoic acid export membrane protein